MATEFERILEQYKANLLEYKVTGQSDYKTRANTAEKWLQDYITTLNKSVEADAAYINKFVKDYENTNPELIKFQKEIQNARKKGPELSDIYEGEQKVMAEEPVDETLFYTKVAAIGGILALAAVASFF
jgi:flagellar biosynthesis chaperone FliJ